LLSSLTRITDDSRLAAWLATVTRRQAWRVRNRNRNEESAKEGPWEAVSPLLLHWIDPAADIERSISLYAAVQSLGEPCASLLTALYFEAGEPSYAEVAVRLGRPVGSIGPTRARCLRRLKQVLDEGAS
jgi:DNA-directed RNA polymerase specialized sigma24 family protein